MVTGRAAPGFSGSARSATKVADWALTSAMSPTIQIDLLKHSAAYFPYRNPGLFTIPLSFIIGIVTSLLWPEPAAQEGFTKLEHQIHLGEEDGA